MKSKYSSKNIGIVFLVLSVAVFGIIAVNAEHDTIAKTVSSGDNTIAIRDISNTANTTQSVTLSGNLSPGNTLTVSVTDTDANLNSTGIETTTVTSNSTTSNTSTATSILTESGANTGFYTGTLILSSSTTTGNTLQVSRGDDLTVDYDAETQGVSRLSASFLGLTGLSTVTLGDFIVDTSSESNNLCPIVTVTHPITMTASGEANTKSVVVTMSYANALLTGATQNSSPPLDPSLFPPSLLKIGFRTSNGDAVGILKSITVDTVAKTVTGTNDLTFTGESSGQYILGFNGGCAGGGGGGLVSPGLVVNALAGIGGIGGGGGGSPGMSLNNLLSSPVIDVPEEIEQMVVNHDSYSPLLPMNPDSFEGFDFPLVINDKGFVLGGFTNTLQTQIIKTDTPVTMKFTVYTADKVQHFSLYTNLRDTNDSIGKSDTQILYNDGKDLQIIDPQGFFSDAKITVTEEEDSVKKQILVEMTFAKEMDTSHVMSRMWDSHLRSGDTHILDAIKVESIVPEFNPIPQVIEEVETQELTSQIIPKWVKNNAGWWVDDQIDDESFITGMQYLISNGIMYVPNDGTVNSSVTEIPDWIKNNAGWWADDQISDDDFVNAMEWLVTNGVISIG